MLRIFFLFITLIAISAAFSVPNENSVQKRDPNGRIVGGKLTDISNHPHQISMRYKACNSCSFNHRCGGSIVTKNMILTAAHCVNTISNPKRLIIVAGANERNGHGVIAPVKKIIFHGDYQKNVPYENDIAILVLGIELELNEHDVKAIGMAEKRPVEKDIARITGWGTTTEGGMPSDYLLEVDVPIVSAEFCESQYGVGRINLSMLCAGSPKGGKDACQGDSGGPLVTNGVLSGVVSWGNGCARPEYAGVYASVADLRTWIDKVIMENS